MPIFEKPPIETLSMFKDRWTPLYLEHGRLEVDDSSVKWINAEGLVCPLPIACISAILLGPGVSITHAAIKACAESNALICWVGEESMRFYSYGIAPTHTNDRIKLQVEFWSNKKKRLEVARKMYQKRFPGVELEDKSLPEMRGMEGVRVRSQYSELGEKYGVTWKGRRYDRDNWDLCDEINLALTIVNQCLYSLCHSVIYMLGFLPQLGFIHETGYLPFVYDIADLYKSQVAFPAAFETISLNHGADENQIRRILKEKIEAKKLIEKMPMEILQLFEM